LAQFKDKQSKQLLNVIHFCKTWHFLRFFLSQPESK
jgi:hypothetical protein